MHALRWVSLYNTISVTDWLAISTICFACAYPKLLSCGDPRWIFVSLIEWVVDTIWEDAGRETRGDFVCLVGISRSEGAIVYQGVVSEEGESLSRRIRDIISEITRNDVHDVP